MYLSTVHCDHICEKQLLKLIMILLKYYTFIGFFVYLALKNFPSADIARQTQPPFVLYPISQVFIAGKDTSN